MGFDFQGPSRGNKVRIAIIENSANIEQAGEQVFVESYIVMRSYVKESRENGKAAEEQCDNVGWVNTF
ncbi:hypothetical protein AA0488_1087 [Kozakia baliensis NRIC 0488]|nr:hypothetical protein AA0488_1087 [Kozakia baliensis NRIC 0488]